MYRLRTIGSRPHKRPGASAFQEPCSERGTQDRGNNKQRRGPGIKVHAANILHHTRHDCGGNIHVHGMKRDAARQSQGIKAILPLRSSPQPAGLCSAFPAGIVSSIELCTVGLHELNCCRPVYRTSTLIEVNRLFPLQTPSSGRSEIRPKSTEKPPRRTSAMAVGRVRFGRWEVRSDCPS